MEKADQRSDVGNDADLKIEQGNPFGFLAATLIFNCILLLLLGLNTYRTYRYGELAERYTRIEELRGSIVHMDEVLTMSARMAVSSGDLSWEERYHKYEVLLDEAITKLYVLAPDASGQSATKETDEANVKLVELESQAFELVREGRGDEAKKVMFSDEYEQLKQTYAEGMDALNAGLSQAISDGQKGQRIESLVFVATVIVSLPLLLIAWIAVFRVLRKWRTTLIENNQRLARQTTDLAESNTALEEEVAQRQRTEESLRESGEQFRALFENAPEAVVVLDVENTRFVDVNENTVRLLKYSREELLEMGPVDISPAIQPGGTPSDEVARERIGDAMRGGAPVFEFCHVDSKGKEIPCEIRLSILPSSSGKLVRASIIDISERKLTEQALEDHAKKQELLNESLSLRNAELDEFSYIASHDLQEPLRKITAFSGLLKMDLGDALPDDAKENLDFLTDAASRMQTLINDLLMLSRSGRREMARERISLEKCADSAIEALSVQINQSGAEIEREELPELWGDKTLLTQLFQNLINNALKFQSAGVAPKVRLTAESTESGWLLGVKDNGIGIEAQYAEQVFAPFKRLHGQEEYKGTGIGLSICRKAVERHGGKIWVESEPGKGSHFKFTIQVRKESM